MSGTERPPVGVLLSSDIEFRKDRKEPYRAVCVGSTPPLTGANPSPRT